MRILATIIIVLLAGSEILAQSFYGSRRNRNNILTVGAGTTSYFGDINDPGDRFDAKPNINLGFQYYFNERFGARAELAWFQLQGDDADVHPERGLSFRTNGFDLNVVGVLDIIPHGMRFYQREAVTPYVFLGLGLAYFNPTGEYQGQRYDLQPLQTEGVSYSKTTLVIPYGGGVKFKAGPFFNIGLEYGYRHALTDYLDDVSSVYVDKSSSPPYVQELANPSDRPVGAIRGNPEDNDGYAILSIKVEYYLPGDLFKRSGYSRRPPSRRRGRRR